jgi:Bacteriocin-protection, YdeI or OmpD-Associated/Domain of unknown function (DUF1905)
MGKRGFSFEAKIEMIGINPFVFLPGTVLQGLFAKAGKDKGPIPVKGSVNGASFTQTLVKYAGAWRLYINTIMLKDSPKRVGETIKIIINYDPVPRIIEMHPKLESALKKNKAAKKVFESLPPSTQKEIIRYISYLKSAEAVERNVVRAIDFLLGKGDFVGRKAL